MVLSALIALSNAAIGAGPIPLLLIAARALYGFAICGLFIVAQSWLNDTLPNSIRGRVMAVFYVAYIGGLGIGYATLAAIDIHTAAASLIALATDSGVPVPAYRPATASLIAPPSAGVVA